MPSTDMIVWAAISGLIILMLGIIGYLVKSGFESIKTELSKIWDKLESNAQDNADIRVEMAAVKARCETLCAPRNGDHYHRRINDANE